MKNALSGILQSKKIITTIVGIAATLAARYGFELDTPTVIAILGVLAVLVGAQGAADVGKESARIIAGDAGIASGTIVIEANKEGL